MSVYLFVLSAIFLICLFGYCTGDKIKTAIICGAILILVSGLRYCVGTDYRTYMSEYIYNYSKNYEIRQFALYLIAHISKYIYDDYSTWFIIMSVITMGFAIASVYKNSQTFYFSLILLIIMGFWSSSFNIVKQCAAASIIFYFHFYIYERKFVKWLLICMIASLFHVTAILCIPIYFLYKLKNIKVYIIFLAFGGMLISLNFDKLFETVAILKNAEIDLNAEILSRQVNFIRIFVECIPSLMFLFSLKKVNPEDRNYLLLGNISLLHSTLYICGMNSVYLLRFCGYTSIFNILLLPSALKKIDNEKFYRLIVYISSVLYTMFWLFDLNKVPETSNFNWIFER